MKIPSFSVITITFNAEKYLERTIRSVIAQTSDDYEYLIIDGGSSDNTLSIAEKYKPHIHTLLSEKDRGIYDAMNKGMKLAKGRFVWFMNAGDEIARPDVMERMLAGMPPESDVIYGDTFFVNEDGHVRGLRSVITPHKLPQHLHWKDMKMGMLVCHQSFLAARAIAPEFIMNNLSADIDWEIKCLKKANSVYFFEGVIARYLEGGVSNRQLKRSLTDRFKVLREHFGFLPTLLAHLAIAFRGIKLILTNKGKYW